LTKAFEGHQGALVLIDCKSGETGRYNPDLCAARLPPCSTFKIWNTAIGLETGLLTSADQPFWKWDGVRRTIVGWNQDLTLRQAYAASCVPAYQALARKIGPRRMNEWIHKLGYGNEDTSSGNDVFWLPAPDRTPILISPDEQAGLIRRLVNGDLPFSKETLTILKEIMTVKTADRGTLYGKTGTGGAGKDTPAVGWFVGYVVSDKSTVAFACVLKGKDATGKNARTLVEKLLL
jgi:beta-lactamase class D